MTGMSSLADDAGSLPMDAVSEILLRLPSKQLCRLRTVCRAWRSLLTAPWFVAAHAARSPEPYIIVASYADHADRLGRDGLVDVLDMSTGRIINHVSAANPSDAVVSVSSSGLVCVKTVETGAFRLLDPVTGAVHRLPSPGEIAPEHAARGFGLRDYSQPVHVFGQVAGTTGGGEIKVLRMLSYRRRWRHRGGGDRNREDLFEVCTLNSGEEQARRWRGVHGPPRSSFVWNEQNMAVVGGVVYCLSTNRRADDDARGWIVRFDLEEEEWRPSVDGPRGVLQGSMYAKHATLASLNNNGSLVIVHGSRRIMDLWFLVDPEEGVWVKRYSVQVERSGHLASMCPLLVLEDGRIVTVIGSMNLLQIYDPRTSTFASLIRLRRSSRVSVHTGSFLSLHMLRTNSR